MNLKALAESRGRNNNFNLLRVAAAAAVLLSHCFPLAYGATAVEPLSAVLGHSLGHLAVLIFFIISGFFVSQSFDRCSGLPDFIAARVLRIYPGLIVVLAFSIVVVGPVATQMSILNYYTEPEILLYLLKGLTLGWLQVGLPGVFLTNPFPIAVNGSLWTLFYEVVCYAGAVLAAVSIRSSERRRSAIFVGFWVGYFLLRYLDYRYGFLPRVTILRNFLDLAPAFVAGMMFFHYRARIILRWSSCAILAFLSILLYRTAFFEVSFLACLSFLIFLVGFKSIPFLHGYNRFGDYSYGVYIYAFPVQQTVAWLFPGISAFGLFCVAAPMVMALSIASWHFIEEPALKSRGYFRMRWTHSRLQVTNRA